MSPPKRLETLAITNRYDLAAARKELEVAARTLGITREWRWLFGVDIGATAERDTDGQWVVGPSLSLELPIFDQRQARIAREEALLRKEVAKLTALAVGGRLPGEIEGQSEPPRVSPGKKIDEQRHEDQHHH